MNGEIQDYGDLTTYIHVTAEFIQRFTSSHCVQLMTTGQQGEIEINELYGYFEDVIGI